MTSASRPAAGKNKPAELPPGQKVGEYTLIRSVARGGFGVVYLAKGPDHRTVAIKEYLPGSLVTRDPGSRTSVIIPGQETLYRLGLRSFFDEARTLSQISHPSVVRVLNFFRENETVYLVMERLVGMTLQDFLLIARKQKRKKILRESTIRSLFDDILQGLRIVHQNKILHLDIKPANIFITDTDQAVLIDFGAAREVIGDNDSKLRPMYTPGFAATEMYRRGDPLGPWTDLYSIGASIYSCMTGHPPHDAKERVERDRLHGDLSNLRGIYSDNMIEIVEWCLSMDPMVRPQSAFSLQKELLDISVQRRYSEMGLSERLRLKIETVLASK